MAMAKIPAGVGPKLPQIVVLFGATGDLAHKKLLPGLFHLVSAGFISKWRIIGVSLDAIDAEGFRALAREAVFEQHAHHPKKDAWPAFEALLDYVPIAAGAGALKEGGDEEKKPFPPFFPVAFSSRSGTAISSIMCRSMCRRRSTSAIGLPSTSRPAPIAT